MIPCWRFVVAAGRDLAIVALVAGVRCYQAILSPLLGPSCRFTPTCSQYAIDAVRRHGPLAGSWRALHRIARCHPWSRGGHDPA
ncbi:MAG: membrane protein insertion efficiency factor YidD [Lacipirellulaceae bacterium]